MGEPDGKPQREGRLAHEILGGFQAAAFEAAGPRGVQEQGCLRLALELERYGQDGTDSLTGERFRVCGPPRVFEDVGDYNGRLVRGGSHPGAFTVLEFDLAEGLGSWSAACNCGRRALAKKGDAAQYFVSGSRKISGSYACELVQELLNIGAVEKFLVQVLGD